MVHLHSIAFFLLQFIVGFLVWTFISYWIHRAAHWHNRKNILWILHQRHHQNNYRNRTPKWPEWYEYFFWFHSTLNTLDIIITFLLPLLIVVFIIGGGASLLLPVYYLYEVFLADDVVEHNYRIGGKLTKFFSIGQYHLFHHERLTANYSFFITLWDFVFRTANIDYLSRPKLKRSG